MNTQLNFKKRALEDIVPSDKRVRYRDSGGANSVKGLGLDVLPSGSKTFRFEQKVNGKNIKVTLGKFPEITIEQARGLAKENAHKIANGTNPNQEKQNQRNLTTFDELFDIYKANFELDVIAGKRRASSFKGSETIYRLHLKPLIGKKAIDLFTKTDAKALLNKLLADKGYSLHNRALTLLKSMYNRADIEPNPLDKINKIDESVFRRERTLTPDEMIRLFESLDKEDPIYKDCILMLLLTGQRKANVLSMRWEEINQHSNTWIIPVEKIKSKRPHVVPLSKEAMEILNRRSTEAEEGQEFVFPSHRSKGGYITDKSGKGGFWHRITDRAGLHDSDNSKNNLQIHDLRRTLATYQVSPGGSLQATSKLLGHSNIGITADVYAHLSVDNVRAELQKTTQFMLGSKATDKLSTMKADIQKLDNAEMLELMDFLKAELAETDAA
ncbi:tyrosine-type recombinase/integrase [uncultured Vibrio sp.]|uniref:tyrosine-type recombinase/integrase n=1 Tax=uncultured Vibrio sp. TaxID=114054 RepID=UPI0025E3C8CE|nr:tyrosine-type recombinase/integrase [uncultured Vibrio sp.]